MNPSFTRRSIAVLTIMGGKEEGTKGKRGLFNKEKGGEEINERNEVEGNKSPILASR